MTGAYIPVIYDAFIPIASTAITEPESLPSTQCSPSAAPPICLTSRICTCRNERISMAGCSAA